MIAGMADDLATPQVGDGACQVELDLPAALVHGVGWVVDGHVDVRTHAPVAADGCFRGQTGGGGLRFARFGGFSRNGRVCRLAWFARCRIRCRIRRRVRARVRGRLSGASASLSAA